MEESDWLLSSCAFLFSGTPSCCSNIKSKDWGAWPGRCQHLGIQMFSCRKYLCCSSAVEAIRQRIMDGLQQDRREWLHRGASWWDHKLQQWSKDGLVMSAKIHGEICLLTEDFSLAVPAFIGSQIWRPCCGVTAAVLKTEMLPCFGFRWTSGFCFYC